jgi:hypothetical protein
VLTLRPLWQRLGVIAGEGLVGSCLAMMIIIGRTRIIRRLWVLPSVPMTTDASIPKVGGGGNHNKHVFLQSVYHSNSQGQLYPYKSCKLQDTNLAKTSAQAEMLLKVDGIRGYYSLPLEGAKINGQGQPSSARQPSENLKWVRQELQDAWRAEGGARRRQQPRFISGPVTGIAR